MWAAFLSHTHFCKVLNITYVCDKQALRPWGVCVLLLCERMSRREGFVVVTFVNRAQVRSVTEYDCVCGALTH